MCFLKACGGLCFKDLSSFNQTLIAKKAWRILQNPNSLIATDIVAVVSKLLPSFFSAELGEFLILREGLVLAKSLNLSISVAEDDASNIASTVNSSSPFCSDASFIISDIKALCKEVGS
ncbi:hypothetical protein ACOSP7_015039 [Xanthoceras sorbifolium]